MIERFSVLPEVRLQVPIITGVIACPWAEARREITLPIHWGRCRAQGHSPQTLINPGDDDGRLCPPQLHVEASCCLEGVIAGTTGCARM